MERCCNVSIAHQLDQDLAVIETAPNGKYSAPQRVVGIRQSVSHGIMRKAH